MFIKTYVGQTRRSIEERFKEHARAKSYFGSAIRKCGRENFSLKILEECSTLEQLNEREKFWIITLNTKRPNGYNLTDGGRGNCGYIPTAQARKNMSRGQKKRFENPDECEKYRKMMTGRKDSEETRIKKSVARKKRFVDNPELGKNHSQAMKNFYAEHPEALVAKAEQGKGRKQSPETIAKRSASRKKYFAKKRQEREEAMRRFKSMMIIFLLVIQNDTPTLATGMDGLMSIVIADAARKSAEENRPVKISELMPKL